MTLNTHSVAQNMCSKLTKMTGCTGDYTHEPRCHGVIWPKLYLTTGH